ncbi:hypothetical protein QBC38DRAFT_454128 [Podospora fimiseda]|uniref:SH3 domain-containing protein n=1 Tax=Podospora fimiseda TaxID=252190 RepID=A0AAN7H0K7_9PEZI|nr:hypothetical protein QBC38DRAFT_454128 [Podospora fimiseda]
MAQRRDKMRHDVVDVPLAVVKVVEVSPAPTQAPNLDLRGLEARQQDTIPPEITNPGSSIDAPDVIIVDTPRSTTSPTVQTSETSASTVSTSAPSSTPGASEDGGSGGLSTAAKAGIAMGALGGILLIFVIVYFIITSRKKKLEKRKQQIEDDEKINGPFTDKAAAKSSAEAPRLSLRPVTQLWPGVDNKKDDKSGGDKGNDNLKAGSSKDAHPERRTSRGINLNLSTIPSASERSNSPLSRPVNGGSAWERPTVNSTKSSPTPTGNRPDTNTSFYSTNPFNDAQALAADEPVSPVSTIDREAAFDEAAAANSKSNTNTKDSTPEPVSPIDREEPIDFDAAAAAAAKVERRSSIRKEGLPAPLDLTKPSPPGLNAVPPSPAGTEYSLHSMAPGQPYPAQRGAAEIAAAGGPPDSMVHRVQLDFKPTLQDELSLKSGQLVRLLHEYDDGWALCIRLDRSEQGVVPRTCLSTRPVKPRPAGPPVPKKDSNSSLRSAGASSSRYSPVESRSHSPGHPQQKSPLGHGEMPPPGQAY